MMLRDRIAGALESALDAIAVWLGLAMTLFIGWALSRHMSWEDAAASCCFFLLVLRAVRKRGDP
jgi:uncharacterized membrane protein YedE/YeeE